MLVNLKTGNFCLVYLEQNIMAGFSLFIYLFIYLFIKNKIQTRETIIICY